MSKFIKMQDGCLRETQDIHMIDIIKGYDKNMPFWFIQFITHGETTDHFSEKYDTEEACNIRFAELERKLT